MSAKVEKLEGSMALITITRPAEDFDKAVDKVYQRRKGQLSAPGFRKGKMPRQMAERLFGEGIFYEDAANNLINESYPEEAENCGEEIVSMPEISVVQLGHGQEFIYTAKVALKPPVSLGKYKGIEVEPQDETVTAEEVDEEIGKELEKNARFEDVTDRPVKDKDIVTLDFEGSVDGVPFEGGKGSDYPLTIGSGSFIPGFEEQLIGVSLGEEKDVEVTFPEEYHAKELAGKAAVFHCKINRIREKVMPVLDDAFADEVSEFSTLEEYKKDVEAKLIEKNKESAKTAKENAVLEAIVEDAAIEIPEPMLRTQIDQMIDEFAQNFRMQGLSMEQYYQFTGTNREQMEENMKPQAERRIRTRLVLEAIAETEKVEVSQEDVDAEIAKMAEQYRMEVDKIKELMGEREIESMKKDLAVQKAVDLVTGAAVEKKAKKKAKKTEE